jgi:predicted ATPase/DNA-binding XRE family transcriptional regulator
MGRGAVTVFGQLLRESRTRLGLTQAALAERSGVAAVTISDLERGVWKTPRADTAVLLANALELSPDERIAFFRMIEQERPERPRGPVRAHPALSPDAGTAFPVRPAPLLGRERELERLIESRSRLLTLVGPGGVGKTRLALERAHQARRSGRRVIWVGAESLPDPADLLPAIARAAGAEVAGLGARAAIADVLRGQDALLVVDNLEHLLEAAPDLAALLDDLPGLAILATSREALQVRGERVMTLEPLPTPGDRPEPEDLAANPAIALFLWAQDGEAASAADRVAAARIVTMLDGLPLAIELAAAQRAVMPADAIAMLLEHAGLRALEGGRRDGPPRFRTMEAALAWSVDRLSEAGQRLLAMLGVFRGGFTAEAASAVATHLGEPALLAELPGLLSAHLVRAGSGGRLSLLEPVRLFAEERLRSSGRLDATRRAHALWFLGLADRLSEEALGPEPLPALELLEADLANIRAAIAASAAMGDAESAQRTAASLRRFWEYRDFRAEGRASLEMAIAAATGPVSASLLAALSSAAYLAMLESDYPKARAANERLRVLALEAGAPAWSAWAILNAWPIASDAGDDPRQLQADLREALALAEGAGPEGEFARWVATLYLGVELQERGDAREAVPLLDEAAAWVVSRERVIDQPVPLSRLGLALLEVGREREAWEQFAAAAAICGRLGLRGLAHFPLLGTMRAGALAGSEASLSRAAMALGATMAMLGQRHAADEPLDLGTYWNGLLADSWARIAAGLGEDRAEALRDEARELSLDGAMALIPGAAAGHHARR